MPNGRRAARSAAAIDESLLPISVGRRLRPIVLGIGGDAALADGATDRFRPGLLLGVHGRDSRLLGYFVAEASAAASWGGLAVGRLTAGDVILLARRTRAACSPVGLRCSVHQAVCLANRDLEEYLDALQPLSELDIGRLAFTEEAGELGPVAAKAAAAAAAAALVIRTLALLHVEVHRARIAIYAPNGLTGAVAAALRSRGALVELSPSLSAAADVLLVGQACWRLGPAEAGAIRARALLPLAATYFAPGSRERLAARAVFLIPEPLVLGGMLTALDFRARGLAGEDAQGRGVAAALASLQELVQASPLEARRRSSS